MKNIYSIIIGMCLLFCSVALGARSMDEAQIYVDDTFTSASDTVGWTISGTSAYNWAWSSYMTAGSSYSGTGETTLTSPRYTLTSRGADLSFKYIKGNVSSLGQVSVLCNGVLTLIDNEFPVTGAYSWVTREYALSSFAGQTIQLVFSYTNMYNYFKIDDVKLVEGALCPKANDLAILSSQPNSAKLSWSNANTDTYTLLLTSSPQTDLSAPTDVVLQQSITATATASGYTYNITGLTAATTYYAYLQSDCSALGNDRGVWSEGLEFSTPCAAMQVPFSDDFETTFSFPCWTISSSNYTQPTVKSESYSVTNKVISVPCAATDSVYLLLPLMSENVERLMISFSAKSSVTTSQLKVGLISNPNDKNSIIELGSQTLATTWTNYIVSLKNTQALGRDQNIVLYLPKGASTSYFTLSLDSIMVQEIPSCMFPLELTVNEISDQSCQISWSDQNDVVTGYTIEYTPENGTAQTITTTDNPYVLSGLLPNTNYTLRVRNNCTTSDQSDYSALHSFKTQTAAMIVTSDTPALEDFESSNSFFSLENGTQHNQWMIGDATSVSPSHALYISADGSTLGSSYNASYTSSYVYAYANVVLPEAGSYNLSFQWKAQGTEYGSYAQVYFVDSDQSPVAGQNWGTAPDTHTVLGGKYFATANNAWKSETLKVMVDQAKRYRIVIQYYGSYSSVGNYVAFDDIQVSKIACERPTEFTENSVTATTADLSWTSAASDFTLKVFDQALSAENVDTSSVLPVQTLHPTATSLQVTGLLDAHVYYMFLRANCDATHQSEWVGPVVLTTNCLDKTIPFSENFNAVAPQAMPLCWNYTPSLVYAETTTSTTRNIDGSSELRFTGSTSSDSYAILPQLTSPIPDLVLEFDYMMDNDYCTTHFQAGYVTDINDMSTFVSISTFDIVSGLQHAIVDFSSVDASVVGRLAIRCDQTSGWGTTSGAVDNVEVYQAPSCWPIQDLWPVTNLSSTGFTLSWIPSASSARNFVIEYGPKGFIPGSGVVINALTDTSYTFSGLSAATSYEVYVMTSCGVDGVSSSKKMVVKTLSLAADATNYSCDFEDATENNQWNLINNDEENRWEIGTQAFHNGQQGLYVVNPQGGLGYNTTASNSWIFRTFNCLPGSYTVSFDYQCQGDNSYYDYFNSVVVPGVFIPQAGQDEGLTYSTVPTTWQTGSPVGINHMSHWTTYTYQFDVAVSSQVTLAFRWTNNTYTQVAPALIDNITIAKILCSAPTDFKVEAVTSENVSLSWQGSSATYHIKAFTTNVLASELDTTTQALAASLTTTSLNAIMVGLHEATPYYFYIQSDCGENTSEWMGPILATTNCTEKSLPYTEDFNTQASGLMPLCWNGTEERVSVNAETTSTISIDGTPYLSFVPVYGAEEYAILPRFNAPISTCVLEFDYRSISSYSPDFTVGYVTNVSDMTSFVEVLAVPKNYTALDHALVSFSGVPDTIEGRLAIRMNTTSQWSPGKASVDNIEVYPVPSCWPILAFNPIEHLSSDGFTVSWTPNMPTDHNFILEYGVQGFIPGTSEGTVVSVTDTTSYTLQGLIPATYYDVYVSQDCGVVDGRSSSKRMSVKTPSLPASALAYACDFEDALENNNWMMAQNESSNHWAVGDSMSVSGHGMYVHDAENNFAYDGTSTDIWAYRSLNFTPGEYTVSFDYICEGQSYADYLNAVIAPRDFAPRVDEPENLGYTLPDGWKSGATLALALQSTWTSYAFSFTVDADTTLTLAFHWHNDMYTFNDPAALDNIMVEKLTCISDTVFLNDQFCAGATSYSNFGFNINDPQAMDYSTTSTSSLTGCDSVTVLHLSAIASSLTELNARICEGERYVFGTQVLTNTGDYTETFTALSTGCDSVVNLHLTVNPSYLADTTITISQNALPFVFLSLVVGDTVTEGQYNYVIEEQTALGCDSIINLDLTITPLVGVEGTLANQLSFYPNVIESGQSITIQTNFTAQEREGLTLSIYNAVGKLVSTFPSSLQGKMSYTLEGESGMYYLCMRTQSGRTFSGKLIIL